MRRHAAVELVAEPIVEVDWLRSHILVRIKSSETTRKSRQISNRSDLNHRALVVIWVEIVWPHVALIVMVLVVVSLVVMEILHLLWHWRKSHTFWQVWKWISQLSSFSLRVVERAAISEFATLSC
jgi:hypothetical protein